jgi:small multidrug resistance family-3 protein
MQQLKLIAIFLAAAAAEIIGCYFTYSYFVEKKPAWILLPAGVSLCLFAWLLSLQTGPAGRTYAAYGGIYISCAVLWMWKIEGIKPDQWDLLGASITLIGMGIIAFAPRA